MAGAALAALVFCPGAFAQDVAYTGSLQFSTGKYLFTERTNSFYLFSGLTASAGVLRLSASFPVIVQSTPWVSYAAGGMVPSGGTQHSEARRGMPGDGGGQGMGGGRIPLDDTTSYDRVAIGDPLGHADVRLVSERRTIPAIRLGAKVKVPIADVDRGFGTGRWDYAAGLALSKSVAGTFVFADVEYWWLGDLPDLELRDALGYSVALGRSLGTSGRLAVLASLSGYTEILPGIDPPVQAALGLSYRLPGARSLSGTAAFGLTESAPDISLGIGWRVPL